MKPGKIIIVYSFLVCLFLMLVGIISAKNTGQLFTSFIFLPLIFYFGIMLLQTKKKTKKTVGAIHESPNVIASLAEALPAGRQESPPANTTPAIEPEVVADVPDNNKRLFLKLIGSAGFSLLLMSLFTKKAQASFFGSAPTGPGVVGLKDSTGKKIDPAEKRPTDGYEISNIDDAGSPAYYGFLKKTGEWYILQDNAGAFRYAKGSDGFAISWAIRGTLTYDYFNNVFG